MICIQTVKNFCCEDISLIENYEQAINDKTQTWECHHRKETDEKIFRKQLIKNDEYYNRPANELIFLTKAEHTSLHNRNMPIERKNKLCESLKGENHPMYGKHHSEETIKKFKESRKGECNGMYGKHHSEETKQKISEAHRGKPSWNKGKKMSEEYCKNLKGKKFSEETRQKISEAHKGKHRVYHEDGTYHYER